MEASRALRPVPANDHDALATAARQCANLVGLRDWTVIVDEEPPDDPKAQADVRVDLRRRALALRFAANFAGLTEDEQRHALAHELLHVHVELLGGRVRQLSPEFGRTAWAVFWSGYEEETERVVDALASVVAPLLPSIDWP